MEELFKELTRYIALGVEAGVKHEGSESEKHPAAGQSGRSPGGGDRRIRVQCSNSKGGILR